MQKSFLIITVITLLGTIPVYAKYDTTDLIASMIQDKPVKQYITNAFKSSRVINGHSIEFIGKGVLDVRILHRFGYVNEGVGNLFGLDEASMRMGLDYGLSNNFSLGIGRSTNKKELDGFIKYRVLRQSEGPGSSPVSIVWVSGISVYTTKWADPLRKNIFSSRVGYYHEIIFGRKFSDFFTLQLAPVYVHRNLIDSIKNSNDTWALGIGSRIKISKRVAFVIDYHPVLSGKQSGTYNPLSLGFDIETGGHVFQLHFSNATGMNEKEFITNTRGSFWKGDIRFGFNLSRVFSLRKNSEKAPLSKS
ncbi:MAG: DUF5777 family beta-barrel protein [Chitinophagaceae bacterium]